MTRVVFWTWLDAWGSVKEDWVRRRFALWRETALRSVIAQADSDWRYLLLCGAKHRGVTSDLAREIDDERVSVVHGPDGERAWRRRLPNARLYVSARLDSDDMYHPHVVGDLKRAARKKNTWLRFVQGYAWDASERRLFRWRQKSSPFYAHVQNARDFRNARSVPRPSHNAQQLASARALPHGRFIVTIHDSNTTTGLQTSCRGIELRGRRRSSVLDDFGITEA